MTPGTTLAAPDRHLRALLAIYSTSVYRLPTQPWRRIGLVPIRLHSASDATDAHKPRRNRLKKSRSGAFSLSLLNRLHIGIANGVATARV